jgi:hypothetical protein
VDVSKYDSAHWIETGLELERAGNLSGAEKDLLQAADVDRLYQPRWTLAGFYFRQGDREKFLRWMGAALAVGRRDMGALYDLCWKLPAGCPDLWGTVMPDSKPAMDEYLFYLMTAGKWSEAARAAEYIANASEAADVPLLMNYCDAALARGDKAQANTVWYHLCHRKLIPYAADKIVANGDFHVAPSGRGFDWRIAAPGVANAFRQGEARFTLNGFQREREVLLEQPLAIDPTLQYRLAFEYRTSAPDVHWLVGSAHSGALAVGEWTHGTFDFAGPAESIALIYERPKGSSMAEGTVEVRNVSIVIR